jgi:hypothetical protein
VSVVRIAASSVVGTVLREQPEDPIWRAHDVRQLLGVGSARLREIARAEGLDRGAAWSLDEVRRLLECQLRGGTAEERERAAEAIGALDRSPL